MKLEHVAIWTNDLERLREYYCTFLSARSNEKYINEKKQFQSYFLSFESGARLEIMTRPGIPANANDGTAAQHMGIIHLAFEMATMAEVEKKAVEFSEWGFPILDGPRKTGDGYFEFVTLDPDGNRIEVTTLYIES